MRTNKIQKTLLNPQGRITIPNDWFGGSLPANVELGENVYIDSAYGFDKFHSKLKNGMRMGKESACYDRASFITSDKGKIEVGEYCILNGTTLICNELISIGNFVMLAWGSVISDNFLCSELTPEKRAEILENCAKTPLRKLPFSDSEPVIIEDNVWIGFDVIVLPGSHIGRGSIIGGKSVVSGIIPEYSVVVGNPAKIVKTLEPTDRKWLNEYQNFGNEFWPK
jgi:acetyltransferase-like isoleucine patch superfamily enzyme